MNTDLQNFREFQEKGYKLAFEDDIKHIEDQKQNLDNNLQTMTDKVKQLMESIPIEMMKYKVKYGIAFELEVNNIWNFQQQNYQLHFP